MELWTRARTWWVVLVLAVASAVVTVVVSVTFFPEGTLNLDEVAYEAQANAMVDGRLTLPAADFVPAFRPYLSAVVDDEVVFKYQPLWPALLAVSKVVSGDTLLVRAVFSALGVLACAGFAYELVRSRRVAIIAAALFALSPFVWVQTASVLGYHPSLVLLLLAAALLLRAARLESTWLAGVGGLVLGAGFLHRPFDAVIAAVPLVVYLAIIVPRRSLLRLVVAVAAGALPFAALMLAYNSATMGSPLRMPFNEAGGLDRFGFGERASFVSPGSETIHFTLRMGLEAARDSLWSMPVFVFAWPAVLAIGGYAVWRHWRERATWFLLAIILTTVAGYVFWWGTANLIDFRMHEHHGPSYHYLVLVPLVVFAAWGVDDLWRRGAAGVVVAAGVIGLAVSIPMSVVSLTGAWDAGQFRADDVALYDGDAPRVVLTHGGFEGDPYVHWANDGRLQGEQLVGLDVPGDRLTIAERFPDRDIFVIRSLRRVDDLFGPSTDDRVPLDIVRGSRMDLRVAPVGEPRQAVRAFVEIDGARELADGDVGEWVLTPAGLPEGRTVSVVLGLAEVNPFAEPTPDAELSTYECRLEARRIERDQIEMTRTCRYVHHYIFPNGITSDADEDLAPVLAVDVQPR